MPLNLNVAPQERAMNIKLKFSVASVVPPFSQDQSCLRRTRQCSRYVLRVY